MNLPFSRNDPRFAGAWSFGSILMLWSSHTVGVGKGFGWDVIPPSFAGSSLKRSHWFYLVFMHSHVIQAWFIAHDTFQMLCTCTYFQVNHVLMLCTCWVFGLTLVGFVSGIPQWRYASRWKGVAPMGVHSRISPPLSYLWLYPDNFGSGFLLARAYLMCIFMFWFVAMITSRVLGTYGSCAGVAYRVVALQPSSEC